MTNTSKPRPLLAIVLLFTLPILLGALIAPPVFNGLRALGEHTEALPKLTEARFEKVTSRLVTIIAALILIPVARRTGLIPEIRAALGGFSTHRRILLSSLALGLLSMTAVYGFGWWMDAFFVSPKYKGPGSLAVHLLEFTAGALLIGLLEEIFFRGLVFGAMRQRLGWVRAALLSSAIFSAIHFFRPRLPAPIEVATWYDGLALIPHMFALFVWPRDAIFAATLFVMGVTLCADYHKRGHLYGVIGLHAGWVLAMLTGSHLFNRHREVLPWLIGHSDTLTKGFLALGVIVLFLIAALRRRKAPSIPPTTTPS